MLSLTDPFGRKRRRTREEELRREHKRQQNLYGGADSWPTYDFVLRAKERGIVGIPDARCFTLQSAIRSLRHVEGDVAECGVRHGKSTVFLLEADRARRQYHLFDSFEGLSEPTAEDAIAGTGQAYWSKGDIAAPEAEARANLAEYPNVNIHPGWIPDTFAAVAQARFAFVHVDVDLYQPTLDSLRFFWPRLVPEGLLICDDYGFATCPGARRAVDEFFSGESAHVLELATGQALVARRAPATAPARARVAAAEPL